MGWVVRNTIRIPMSPVARPKSTSLNVGTALETRGTEPAEARIVNLNGCVHRMNSFEKGFTGK